MFGIVIGWVAFSVGVRVCLLYVYLWLIVFVVILLLFGGWFSVGFCCSRLCVWFV